MISSKLSLNQITLYVNNGCWCAGERICGLIQIIA